MKENEKSLNQVTVEHKKKVMEPTWKTIFRDWREKPENKLNELTVDTIREISEQFQKENDRIMKVKAEKAASFFKRIGNSEIAERTKKEGVPKYAFCDEKIIDKANDTFSWMGIKVVKHNLLENNEVIFIWGNDSKFGFIKKK